MISANSAMKLSISKLSMEERIPYIIESQILHHACEGKRRFKIGGTQEWLEQIRQYVIKRGYTAYMMPRISAVSGYLLEISW